MKIPILDKISNKQKALGSLALMIFALAFLLYLPADHFDEGESICVSVVLFDKECYACGMTRGIQHLLHLDFEKAAEYNLLSFVVLPLGAFMLLSSVYKLYRKK